MENSKNVAIEVPRGNASHSRATVSQPLGGAGISIKEGFEAQSFRARDIGTCMDPLVMVDHYVMTEPTFGAHPHAGMSAVTLLFEDSEGSFHNRDSLGNDFDLQPGDLYWLKAGSGAVHDEFPQPNARTHGLQVFINVPQSQRFESPASKLVRTKQMPVINTAGSRVKVALGESNGIRGAVSPSIPMTILDGTLQPGGRFTHLSGPKRGIWVHAINGTLEVIVGEDVRSLPAGQAIAINTESETRVEVGNVSGKPAHFVMFDGAQIGETYIHDGPFVMDSSEQIEETRAAYLAGQFGGV